MHPETGYKLCKFCESRARDTPLRGVYIPHFDQMSVKISVLGVLYPYRCTDGGEILHGGGDGKTENCCVIPIEMGMTLTIDGSLIHAKFHHHRCNG